MNLTNYHSHCSFCDGKAPMEEFVKAAIREGFVAYGISSHAPLPFETRWTLDKTLVPAYLREISLLKEKYKSEIELYAGMEIDYLNDTQCPAIAYFQQLPLDYRIGSVHLVYAPDGQIVDTDTGPDNFKRIKDENFYGDLKALVTAYFDASLRMVKRGGFDFIGHIDKIFYNAEYCEEGVTRRAWYEDKFHELLSVLVEKQIKVEINTKAYQKKNCFFPPVERWEDLKEAKVPLVVNSDAHFPELVNAGRREALRLLKEKGFKTVWQFMQRKWQEVEID